MDQQPNAKIRLVAMVATVIALLAISIPFVFEDHVDAEPAVPTASDAMTPIASHGEEQAACLANAKPANLDFTMQDLDGKDVSLSSFKGKVILLNFWATWCPPCKAEIPGFIELYAEYKDKGLVILGVSGDDDPDTLKKFASEWKINYPMIVGRDEQALLDSYGPIYGYPISVLVGRDGSVCGRHVGPATKEEFEREIKALL